MPTSCYCHCMSEPPLPTDLVAKLKAESVARQKAVERSEAAEHQCSMLQLDLKSARDEVAELKESLNNSQNKV